MVGPCVETHKTIQEGLQGALGFKPGCMSYDTGLCRFAESSRARSFASLFFHGPPPLEQVASQENQTLLIRLMPSKSSAPRPRITDNLVLKIMSALPILTQCSTAVGKSRA